MSCTNSVASEDFADFIAPYFTTPEEFIRSQGTDCIDFVNSTLAPVFSPHPRYRHTGSLHNRSHRQMRSYTLGTLCCCRDRICIRVRGESDL